MKESASTLKTSVGISDRKENRSQNILKAMQEFHQPSPSSVTVGKIEEGERQKVLENMRQTGSIKHYNTINHGYDLAAMKKITHMFANTELLNLPAINTMLVNERYNTLCLAATCNAILGILNVYTSAVVYDIEYYDFWDENKGLWLQISVFNTMITLLLVFSIYWRKCCELDLNKSEHFYSEQDTIYSSKKIYSLTLEVLLNLPHPLWFLHTFKVTMYNEVIGRHYEQSVNSLLCVLVLPRFYHVFRLVLLQSRYNSARAQRVCKMNGVLANRFWILKCLMNAYPFRVVMIMMIVAIFAGGFCLRIFERPLTPPDAKTGFFDLGNSMWCIIITMTTVGFGDLTPISVLGRIVGTLACIWGVFVVALMVVGVTHFMGLDSGQAKSLIIFQRLKFKDHFKTLAIDVLKSALKFKLITKKHKDSDEIYSIQQSVYKRNIIEFQKARIQSQILYNLNTPERKIEDRINLVLKLGEENISRAEKTFKELRDIQELIKSKEKKQEDDKETKDLT